MTRSLSLHHLSMLRASPDELVRAARSGGFDHCGIRIVSPDGKDDELVDVVHDAKARRRVVRVLEDEGIRVLDVEALWLRDTTDVRALEPALETAAEFGASYFLTVGYDADRPRLLDTLGRFSHLAAQHDIIVPLEFITYTAVTGVADAWDVIRDVGAPNLALLVDALQFFRAGAEFDVLASIPPALLPYAQICDGRKEAPVGTELLRAEARTDRLPPGLGELDLPRLLSALPSGIPLAVEAPTLSMADWPLDRASRHLHDATLDLLARSDGSR